jgi:2-C-methyl-D-erythritol 4-phosphate cytidylyltransferase
MTKPEISAVIVAAGAGTRLGSILPKAFIDFGGKPLFCHSLAALLSHEAMAEGVLVVPEAYRDKALRIVNDAEYDKDVIVVCGGEQRWQSVENGASAADSEWILVHDAARPFVTKAVVGRVIEKMDRFDCVITAIPEVDTMRAFSGELAGAVVDRSKLVRVGTPQLFRRSKLLDAFKIAAQLPTPPTDEAALMQAAGIPVAIAWGDLMNFKITTPADLVMAEALRARQS